MKFSKLVLVLFGILVMSSALSQEISMGNMLDLETKITVSKMKEELAKSENGKLPSVDLPKLKDLPKPVAVNTEPRTISIYGVAPEYKGEMEMNGFVYPVSKGQYVFGRIVTDINARGIALSATSKQGSQKKTTSFKRAVSDQRVIQSEKSSTKVRSVQKVKLLHTPQSTFYPLIQL